jgi:hypothetical protein
MREFVSGLHEIIPKRSDTEPIVLEERLSTATLSRQGLGAPLLYKQDTEKRGYRDFDVYSIKKQ